MGEQIDDRQNQKNTEEVMKHIGIDDAWLELEKCILLQAIEDYVNLRDKKVIVDGDQVEEDRWDYYAGSKFGARRHPLNYGSSKDVKDLIWFLKSSWLDLFCDAIGHKACRVRRRIGLLPGMGNLLTMAELEFYARSAQEKNKHLIGRVTP
jgi:hypothetical protein